MFLKIDSNFAPIFQGKNPTTNPKKSTEVEEDVRPQNVVTVPAETMAAVAGVKATQRSSDSTLDNVQAYNLKLCAENKVSLPPTPENILADIEEPVIVCGQPILGKDVDLTKVNFKSLLEDFAKESIDGKMIVSSSDGSEYEVEVKHNANFKNWKHIFIKPTSNNSLEQVKYGIHLSDGQLTKLKKRTLYDIGDIYTTYKEELFSFRSNTANFSYGDKRLNYSAKYVFDESGKIERIIKSTNENLSEGVRFSGCTSPITHESFDEEFPKGMRSLEIN